MKIRTDYVSNSSSSSFIVAIPKSRDLDQFINDVVKSCSNKKDYDFDEAFVKDVDRFNRRNLDYCMNTYKLLFLGSLKMPNYVGTIEGKDEVSEFLSYMNGAEGFNDGPTILEQSEDKITYSEPSYSGGITVTESTMEYRIKHRCWDKDEDESKARKATADNIVECASHSGDEPFFRNNSEIYEITLDTIENTKILIETGHEVELDDWCKDLDALKKRIEGGDRLFGITMNQGGDGMDPTAIYALNGWDSDFNEFANVEVIDYECG